jgi:hypothetical protein
MMTKMEGNDYQDLVITIAKAYVESDLTWTEVLKIGECMLKGKTCETAAAELNLSQKISPALSVMMAMLDKQTIVDSYNPIKA